MEIEQDEFFQFTINLLVLQFHHFCRKNALGHYFQIKTLRFDEKIELLEFDNFSRENALGYYSKIQTL